MSVGKQMLTGKIKSRQPPTFAAQATIIGAVGLDFRVRDGNGYGTHAMATGIKKLCQCLGHSKETHRRANVKGRDNMAKPRGLLVRLG